MKLEQQACTASQGKRLEELGVNGKSLFSAVLKKDDSVEAFCYNRADGTPVYPENNAKYTHWKSVRVYTVAELGVMLPGYIKNGDKECYLEILKDEYNGFIVDYTEYSESGDIPFLRFSDKTEAYAKCQTLIYLLENNLTTAEEVNQRINA